MRRGVLGENGNPRSIHGPIAKLESSTFAQHKSMAKVTRREKVSSTVLSDERYESYSRPMPMLNNEEGGKYGNALQAAVLLLREGAEVNSIGGRYGYALQAASYHGHADVVSVLLENGAEVNGSRGLLHANIEGRKYGWTSR